MYRERKIKNEIDKVIKKKSKWELELVIIDLYYDNYELLQKIATLKAKYE